MTRETGYHKLSNTNDYDLVKPLSDEAHPRFKHSRPASEHWLGEGVYFFLDPEGAKWAYKWPMKEFHPRTKSKLGIVTAEIDTSLAIDLRNDEQRTLIQEVIKFFHLKLIMTEKKSYPVEEGELFYQIFKRGILRDKVGFVPTAFIANFDVKYEQVRIENSRVFLTIEKCEINPMTAQIQVCIMDNKIIKNLKLVSC